ncbi:MAG: hypothetical protein KZQ57_10060 [gamma proteobacterium symbiont of Lucinoma myriamae]|nr:hypothetical protein [gamma proteobacterium symbiont of Lucinoma myriamae]
MSTITHIKQFKKQQLKKKNKAKTLCNSGFHQWLFSALMSEVLSKIEHTLLIRNGGLSDF